VDHVTYAERPDLNRPPVICAFRGWNDRGEAASMAAGYLVERWGGRPIARIDPEEFYDFQVNRPTVRLEDGVSRIIEWPECVFAAASAREGDVVVFTAAASHYIQDAHQPFHATINWDGQLTGQHGIHSRFETATFDRFESRLSIVPPPVTPLRNPRDAVFEILLASYDLVPALLEADRAAVEGRTEYDNEYYEKFFARVKPVLERRVAESISATASLIVGAWEAAGKPPLRTDMPATVQKVRPPKDF